MPQISSTEVRIAQSSLEQLLLVLAGAMSPSHSRISNLHSNINEK